MKKLALILILISPLALISQIVLKENLSPKESIFWDFNKSQLQAIGSYYTDAIETTKEKHGKWLYYDRFGVLEEERNYYKDMLHGKVVMYYPNKKLKQEGYFVLGRQDSVYREWNENGKLALQGSYKMNEPSGQWTYFYLDGREKSIEEIKGGENRVVAFWLPDSLHTQTIIDGTGEMSTFHTTGTVKEWYNFKNGLKDGPFEEISPYGYITLKGFFKAGEKDSTWTYAYYTGDTEIKASLMLKSFMKRVKKLESGLGIPTKVLKTWRVPLKMISNMAIGPITSLQVSSPITQNMIKD